MALKQWVLAAASGLIWASAQAADFKSASDCVIGKSVADRKGRVGTVVSTDGTLCQVDYGDGAPSQTHIFWMLRAANASPQTDEVLGQGIYPCYAAGNYQFFDVVIEAKGSYRSGKGQGRYQLGNEGKIVFESGPLKPMKAKLLPGPRIGLSADDDGFYSTTCSLKK